MTALEIQGSAAKGAARALSTAGTGKKNTALEAIARALETHMADILAANAEDLRAARACGMRDSLLDRLALNEGRIAAMA
jgi:glutamate-5-semialdehyde dehydrogenase